MATRKGICKNENCTEQGKEKVLPVGAHFRCLECDKDLEEIARYPTGLLPDSDQSTGFDANADEQPSIISEILPDPPTVLLKNKRNQWHGVLAGLFSVVLIGSVWLIFKDKEGAPSLPVGTQVILRLSGSSAIGLDLAPALAEEFLRSEGALNVQRVRGSEGEAWVVGTLPEQKIESAIETKTYRSNTGFGPMGKGECDIVMSYSRVSNEEKEALAHLGDLTSRASEDVLALGGVAIIVNDANPIDALTMGQIHSIFTGLIADWALVSGSPGEIHLYTPDTESGTSDTFKELALEGIELAPPVDRFADSRALSRKVASDLYGIGFVEVTEVLPITKTLKISIQGAQVAIRPTILNVRTEDYPLSRRLYLYRQPASKNPWVRRFAKFAISDMGQSIAEDIGFVGQTISQESIAQPEEAVLRSGLPPAYERLILGAERVPFNIRFRSGNSDELDTKAYRDLGRLIQFMSDRRYRESEVLVLGFSDSLLGAESNLNLSRQRARAVERELLSEGIRPTVVEGFGEELPVARNDTDEGLQKNRRVEIWVRKK